MPRPPIDEDAIREHLKRTPVERIRYAMELHRAELRRRKALGLDRKPPLPPVHERVSGIRTGPTADERIAAAAAAHPKIAALLAGRNQAETND